MTQDYNLGTWKMHAYRNGAAITHGEDLKPRSGTWTKFCCQQKQDICFEPVVAACEPVCQLLSS